MSNYKTQEQLNAITLNFSQIFDIKLHKVRHKVAQKEGFKNHEAHIKSLPSESPIIHIQEQLDSKLINHCQNHPSIYKTPLCEQNLYTGMFDIMFGTLVGNAKSIGGRHLIHVYLNEEKETFKVFMDTDEFKNEHFELEEEKINFFNKYLTSSSRGYDNFIEKDAYSYKVGSSIYDLCFVNALSESFILNYYTENNHHILEFENGKLVKESFKSNPENKKRIEILSKLNKKYTEPEYGDVYSFKEIEEVITEFSKVNEHIDIILNNECSGDVDRIEGKHIATTFMDIFGKGEIMNMDFIKSSLQENIYESVKVCMYDTNDEQDFKCVSYVNDMYLKENGSHVNALKKFLKKQVKKGVYEFNEDLKGLKVLFIFETSNASLLKGCTKRQSYMDKVKVEELLSTDPNGDNLFNQEHSSFVNSDEDYPLRITPDINAILKMVNDNK